MIHAYQETYLNSARKILAVAFDYVINDCKISPCEFVKMFLGSNICKKIENGEPKFLVGKSGVELALDIIEETTGNRIYIEQNINFSRSKEYWVGWVISYYQWYSNRTYNDIFNVVSIDDLYFMYNTLHEADISKFVDIIDKKMKLHYNETNLARIRKRCKMTQKELSDKSGVNLRSIQMYEQKNKDINKASIENIYRIAKVFGCSLEELIEK